MSIQLYGGPADGKIIDDPKGIYCEIPFMDDLRGYYRAIYKWEVDEPLGPIARGRFDSLILNDGYGI